MSVGNVSASLNQPPRAASGNFQRVSEDRNAAAVARNRGDTAGEQRALASLRKNTPTPSEIGNDHSRRTRAEQGTGEFEQLAKTQRAQQAKASPPPAARGGESANRVGRALDVVA